VASDAIVVMNACPDEVTAARIARELIESGLAACVSRLPGQATYRWEGQMVDEAQVILLIKTSMRRYAELERRISSLHPDRVPEIIALPVTAGAAGYLSWLETVLA
jgi:periplasmic divalent cation tolerance protein